jgi:predicted metal-binding membrane protein
VSSAPDLTSRVLRHERAVLLVGIALLVGLSWAFLFTGAGMPGSMDMEAMPPPFAAVAVMWWVMMAAMMLPSALPALLLYANVREARSGHSTIAATWLFLAGYLAVWLLFSLIAGGAQILLGGAMTIANRYAQAILLIAAGGYQLSPAKGACLGQCRSPARFISRYWRAGRMGAVRLGLLHGAYCVGCCWMLMALLFVGGVMNLWWVVALTLLIAFEKLVNGGVWLARVSGLALAGWGVALLVV